MIIQQVAAPRSEFWGRYAAVSSAACSIRARCRKRTRNQNRAVGATTVRKSIILYTIPVAADRSRSRVFGRRPLMAQWYAKQRRHRHQARPIRSCLKGFLISCRSAVQPARGNAGVSDRAGKSGKLLVDQVWSIGVVGQVAGLYGDAGGGTSGSKTVPARNLRIAALPHGPGAVYPEGNGITG